MSESCLFCRIAAGKLQADIVSESKDGLAFRDIHPQSPVHILVIPKKHIASLHAAGESDAALLGNLLHWSARIAADQSLMPGGYRIVTNCGPQAGQSVDHLHLHLLGGRQLQWPPG